MANRLLLALVVLGACAGNNDSIAVSADRVASARPWFIGNFAGTSFGEGFGERFEIGRGSCTLSADGSFELQFKWSDETGYGDWAVSGTWTYASAIGAEDTDLNEIRLDLSVASRNHGYQFGTNARASVRQKEVIMFFGPCVGFALPRAK